MDSIVLRESSSWPSRAPRGAVFFHGWLFIRFGCVEHFQSAVSLP